MPHFITVPEIIDSSSTPYTVKDRHLNVDHIVSFYDTAEGRCSVKTTVKESLDVLLSASELRKLCSPETVTLKGERRPLSMEDLSRFIARSQEPMSVMEPGMDHSSPQMADIGLGAGSTADDYLIGEVVKAEGITVGPLYLIVAKSEKRLNLFRINSNARTQYNLRRVYQALQKEFTERNLTDVLGPMEYWTLGRAATYNHEFVVFHVTPFHSEGELPTTQQWTVDKQQIVVPETAILNDVNKGN